MTAGKVGNKRQIVRPRAETEFLPAALEILETPVSPIKTATTWLISGFAAAAIVWSYIGTLDIVAVAQGKIQPLGRVKVIQSVEPGKTVAIHAHNGARVIAGQVLLELDATEAKAELAAIVGKLHALQAQMARRAEELNILSHWQTAGLWSDVPLSGNPSYEEGTPSPIRERENEVLFSEMAELNSSIQNLRAQKRQQEATIGRLSSMVTAQEDLVATLASRVSMRSGLVDASAGSKAGVLDALETQQQEQAELVELVGQLAEAKAAIQIAESEAMKIVKTFVAENMRRQSEAAIEVAELAQARVAAQRKLDVTRIDSPIVGTVQASALTTVGQVVSAGSELMRIVPDDATLEIEAYLPNRDIGFVQVGHPVVVKVEAFPFTRYGTIDGEVVAIAGDAIPEPDAQQLEGQPAKELQSVIPLGNVQRVQNLVFPMTVRPLQTAIDVDGTAVPLSPGMAVTVEIKTGTRRIIDYLLSPIREVSSEALQER